MTVLRITIYGGPMLVANNAIPLAVSRPAIPPSRPDFVRTRELSATTVLVAAFGEIDAASAAALSERIEEHLVGYRQLVLDLSRLEFFGTAGYSVLHRVQSRCARAGVDWVLVPGPEVERLLRVCDPDGILPRATNIVSAVAALARNHTRRVS
ncbi:MAG: STAS domain-containing protein [Mycobacterium sp.]|nr:STAS domain-containing protein [Mycobacterium sp.]